MTFFSKTFSILTLAGFALMGCQRTAQEVEPYGASISYTQGAFSETKALSLSETPLHADCGTDAGQIDPRLKPGMSFETVYNSINGTKINKTLSVRARIISVDPKRLEERVMPVVSSGVSSGQVGNEEPLICNFDSQNKFLCNNPEFISETTSNIGEYKDCQLSGQNVGISSQHAGTGTFKLVSGKSVNAYQMTTTYQGELFCNNVSIGEGQRVDVLVTSADVPAEGAITSCSGTVLFSAKVYKNSLGRVLLGSSRERTAIP